MILGAKQSTIKKLMFMGGVVGGKSAEESVTGNPARFFTDLAKPLRSMIVPFFPVQSGSNPSPENICPISGWSGITAYRTGVNMYHYEEANVTTAQMSGYRRTIYRTGIKGGRFTSSGSIKPGEAISERINIGTLKDGELSGIGYFIRAESDPVIDKRTIADDEELVLCLTSDNEPKMKELLQKVIVQIELGSTVTPYTEYTGQSYPVTFPALTKNLFNIDATYKDPDNKAVGNANKRIFTPYTFCKGISSSNYFNPSGVLYSISDGVLTVTTDSYGVGFALPLKQGSYRIAFNGENSRANTIYYAEDGTYLSAQNSVQGYGTFDVPSGCAVTVIMFMSKTSGAPATFREIMVNEGDTALPYEPFTNTVYGGTLDAVTGVLSVEWANVDLGSLTYRIDQVLEGIDRFVHTFSDYGGGTFTNIPDIVCETFRPENIVIANQNLLTWVVCAISGNEVYFYTPGGTYENATAFKQAMNGVMFCYKLKTPIEIPLSDIPVPVTLIADNTIWTDTNGENAITFLKKG